MAGTACCTPTGLYAPEENPFIYRSRRPEDGVLHRIIRENLTTFIEIARDPETGAGLPGFVREEFERYLDCGVLASGFLRLRCPDCAEERLIGLSCKGRAFCPSW